MVQTWNTESAGTKKCESCGRKYKVSYTRFPMRDNDHFDCACGVRLDEWNSTHVPSFELIQENETK